MNKATDFEIEMGRIDREISELKESALAVSADSEKVTRFVYRLYQRAALTGNFADLEDAEAAINDAIRRIGPGPDLYYLKANLDFKFHRIADARLDLEMGTGLRDSVQGRALQADLDFQQGRYEDARKEYEAVIQDDRTWDNLARLAHLKAKMGDVAAAEQLYVEAEDELTAKEMKSYSWVELQRGLLDLSHGCYENAWTHYKRADKAYSGHWLVYEHMAEWLGAQGKFDEAIALYEKVIERVPRPEFQQALGELYLFMGKPDQAQPWHEKALAAYLESAGRGEVHYYHHLADFYADVREDGREAVKWARKDIEMRENFSTQAALAWALYRYGQFAESFDLMRKALASGVRDARLFSQAATIYQSVGAIEEANRFLQLATEINPQVHNFHVHR